MQADPYNWPFPQKQDTMYLSNIGANDIPYNSQSFMRDSTFQNRDIFGTVPKNRISQKQNDTNFSLSTYIQPNPKINRVRSNVTNPLRIDDIEGSQPKANQFRTRRIVDPLAPKYQLASCSTFSLDPGRKFIRDTLKIDDINPVKRKYLGGMVTRDPITGSTSMSRTKDISAVSRLQVKDINKDGKFQSARNINPLAPHYHWRDDDTNANNVNQGYGHIEGVNVKKLHPTAVTRKNDFCLNTKDIEGTTSNSCFSRAHFLDKRREFRDYMNIKDVEKAEPCSLKKGIVTQRQVNPLMPTYQFLGNSEMNIGGHK